METVKGFILWTFSCIIALLIDPTLTQDDQEWDFESTECSLTGKQCKNMVLQYMFDNRTWVNDTGNRYNMDPELPLTAHILPNATIYTPSPSGQLSSPWVYDTGSAQAMVYGQRFGQVERQFTIFVFFRLKSEDTTGPIFCLNKETSPGPQFGFVDEATIGTCIYISSPLTVAVHLYNGNSQMGPLLEMEIPKHIIHRWNRLAVFFSSQSGSLRLQVNADYVESLDDEYKQPLGGVGDGGKFVFLKGYTPSSSHTQVHLLALLHQFRMFHTNFTFTYDEFRTFSNLNLGCLPEFSNCLNNGTCHNVPDGDFKCSCAAYYTGDYCEISQHVPASPCTIQPCFNGGSCIEDSSTDGFSCKCLQWNTGDLCESTLGSSVSNACISSPCLNNGTCVATSALTLDCSMMADGDCSIPIAPAYYCTCPSSVYGAHCESVVNICDSAVSVCLNGGQCVMKDNTAQCVCPTGFIGKICETTVDSDVCKNNPCQNKGVCLLPNGLCLCSKKYHGQYCQHRKVPGTAPEPKGCAAANCRLGSLCQALVGMWPLNGSYLYDDIYGCAMLSSNDEILLAQGPDGKSDEAIAIITGYTLSANLPVLSSFTMALYINIGSTTVGTLVEIGHAVVAVGFHKTTNERTIIFNPNKELFQPVVLAIGNMLSPQRWHKLLVSYKPGIVHIKVGEYWTTHTESAWDDEGTVQHVASELVLHGHDDLELSYLQIFSSFIDVHSADAESVTSSGPEINICLCGNPDSNNLCNPQVDPVVNIICKKNCGVQISPSQAVELKAVCSSCFGGNVYLFTWQVFPHANGTTSTSGTCSLFRIESDILTAGYSYEIAVTVQLSGCEATSTTVWQILHMASPPAPGDIIVSPTSGTLFDYFSIGVDGFYDDSGSELTYQYFVQNDMKDTSKGLLHYEGVETSLSPSLLPMGHKSEAYAVKITVCAANIYSARICSQTFVNVLSEASTDCQMSTEDKFMEIVTGLVNTGERSDALSLILSADHGSTCQQEEEDAKENEKLLNVTTTITITSLSVCQKKNQALIHLTTNTDLSNDMLVSAGNSFKSVSDFLIQQMESNDTSALDTEIYQDTARQVIEGSMSTTYRVLDDTEVHDTEPDTSDQIMQRHLVTASMSVLDNAGEVLLMHLASSVTAPVRISTPLLDVSLFQMDASQEAGMKFDCGEIYLPSLRGRAGEELFVKSFAAKKKLFTWDESAVNVLDGALGIAIKSVTENEDITSLMDPVTISLTEKNVCWNRKRSVDSDEIGNHTSSLDNIAPIVILESPNAESFTMSSIDVAAGAMVALEISYQQSVPLYIQFSIDVPFQSQHFYSLKSENGTERDVTERDRSYTWQSGGKMDVVDSENVTFCPSDFLLERVVSCGADDVIIPDVYPFSQQRYKACMESVAMNKTDIGCLIEETVLNIITDEIVQGFISPDKRYGTVVKWRNTDLYHGHSLHIGLQSHPEMMEDCVYLLENVTKATGRNVSSFNVSIEADIMECVFWDDINEKWLNQGCQVLIDSSKDSRLCSCNHLTVFSNKIFVPPNKINLVRDILLFKTFFHNPVTVTLVCVVWWLYIILVIWARRKDKEDTTKAGVTVLEDNVHSSCFYMLTVVTGWMKNGGTTSLPGLYLVGSEGRSEPHVLHNPQCTKFDAGSEASFLLTTRKLLGELEELHIWISCTGNRPDWYLCQVTVLDLQSNTESHFVCNSWLTPLQPKSVYKRILVAKGITDMDFKYRWSLTLRRNLRDQHLWLSIFTRPAYSSFTRVQRLTCALSFILLAMLTNIMFYGAPTDDPEDQIDVHGIRISLSQIVIGIQCSFIAIPINAIIITLFKKSKPSNQGADTQGSKTSSILDEIDLNNKVHPASQLSNISDQLTTDPNHGIESEQTPSQTSNKGHNNQDIFDVPQYPEDVMQPEQTPSQTSKEGHKNQNIVDLLQYPEDLMQPEQTPSQTSKEGHKNQNIVDLLQYPEDLMQPEQTPSQTSEEGHKNRDIFDVPQYPDDVTLHEQTLPGTPTTSIQDQKIVIQSIPTCISPQTSTKRSRDNMKDLVIHPEDVLEQQIEDMVENVQDILDRIEQERTDDNNVGLAENSGEIWERDPVSCSKEVSDNYPDGEDEDQVAESMDILNGVDTNARIIPSVESCNSEDEVFYPCWHCDGHPSQTCICRLSSHTHTQGISEPSEQVYNMADPPEKSQSATSGVHYDSDTDNLSLSSQCHTNIVDQPNTPSSKSRMISKMIEKGQTSRSKQSGLPSWVRYIAWFLAYTVSIIASYIIMLYGLRYGYTKSVSWLVSVLTTHFQQAAVMDPLKVVVIAAVLCLIIKKPTRPVVDHQDYQPPDIDIDTNQEEVPKLPLRVYQAPNQRHVKGVARRLQTESTVHAALYDIGFYFIFLCVVFIIVYGHHHPHAFKMTESITDCFVKNSYFNSTKLDEVKMLDDVWSYLCDTLVPATLSPTAVSDSYNSYIIDMANILVGMPRIRQIRYKSNNCRKWWRKKRYYTVFEECSQGFSTGNEDKESYMLGWQQFNETMSISIEREVTAASNVTSWMYQSAKDINTPSIDGQFATYGGGGYISLFTTSMQQTLVQLQDLKNKRWLDESTAAVVVEFSVFNPSIKMFTTVILLFEVTNVGSVTATSTNIRTLKLYNLSSLHDVYIIIFQVIYIILITVYLIRNIRDWKRSQKFIYIWAVPFKQLTNWLVVFLSILCIFVYIIKVIKVEQAFNNLKQSGMSGFFNWHEPAFWGLTFNYLQASCVTVVLFNFLQILGLNRLLFILVTTLSRSGRALANIGLIIFLCFTLFLCIGIVTLGPEYKEFSTVSKASMTLFSLLLRKLHLVSCYCSDSVHVMAILYVVMFTCAVIALWIPLIQTILLTNLKVTRNDVSLIKELAVLDYLSSYLSSWFGFGKDKASDEPLGEQRLKFSQHLIVFGEREQSVY